MGTTIKDNAAETFAYSWKRMAAWSHKTAVEHGFWDHIERQQDAINDLGQVSFRKVQPAHKSVESWRKDMEREPEGVMHPCDSPAAWDCQCAGACSCHWWEERDAKSEAGDGSKP